MKEKFEIKILEYKPMIGLEVHVQLSTKTKMFCRCVNDPLRNEPNTLVCPVCLGLPGSLPVLNKQAVDYGIEIGLGANGQIQTESVFDRKNYFYPDLPKGYQISQFFHPLVVGGSLDITYDGQQKKVRLRRMHLEEDTAKMIHAGRTSMLDFNRSGIPLIEIVTEPDMDDSEWARMFLKKLKNIIRWLGISEARMQYGEMRCDANISLQTLDGKCIGKVVEIKNLNSFRSVKQALDYEFSRQVDCMKNKIEIFKETRGWDATKGTTYPQRRKEYEHDYRYFAEPDLSSIVLKKEDIDLVAGKMPVMPDILEQRIRMEFGLKEEYISRFIDRPKLFYFYEEVVSELKLWIKDKKLSIQGIFGDIEVMNNKVAGFLLVELGGMVQDEREGPRSLENVTAENMAELLSMFYSREINNQTTKALLEIMVKEGGDPSNIAKDKGWEKKTEIGELEKIAQNILENNKELVAEYKNGKDSLLSFFVGQVMKETKGLSDPEEVKDTLKKILGQRD
ncbi:Asp-tRNA(Asn)/Glu-tRNA(Gln) amidotransferase subunit GatB [Patescibacteria group bacterium]|nr:Asp-tRNA(Asn)/Glu-tRNA(Gln) amidotransferase subunit GatB [Patescibacteria group bacterium]